MRHRNGLPREAVGAPSLEAFQWKVSLPMAEGWNEMIFKVSSNPDHSVVTHCLCINQCVVDGLWLPLHFTSWYVLWFILVWSWWRTSCTDPPSAELDSH